MPVARHNERAPAMLRPAVDVLERYAGMYDFLIEVGECEKLTNKIEFNFIASFRAGQ